MGKVILGTVMSLDGYMNDKNGSISRLYRDYGTLADNEVVQEAMRTTGAVIMGRRNYDMGNGDFTGYEFQTPIFVITHNPPAAPAKGENENLKFHFVTDGVESAVHQAKAAAADKDVTIVGGADVGQQVLKTGLVDELHIDIVSVLLGGGLRFFDDLGGKQIELEAKKVDAVTGITHMIFRVLK
jgi:dihydrofolate reductase